MPNSWVVTGLVTGTSAAVLILRALFEVPAWQSVAGVLLSCLVAVLAVRALGSTDMNPVSGVGKLSQIIFAFLAPGKVVTSLIAGALAEAGATQAGDLLQDLKTGHCLGASPKVQFIGQLIGSAASIFITVCAYQLYDGLYTVPSEEFPAPVAHIWRDMAELLSDGIGVLPESALGFASIFSVGGVALAVMERLAQGKAWGRLVPSGMAFGIGMYVTPDWTLPRVAGAVFEHLWFVKSPESHRMLMLMVASGFVLGEGVASIGALALKALNVPTL